jgi:hypothetical protein
MLDLQFPIAIYITVPVQTAAIAGSLELLYVDIDIGFSEPWR